MKKEFEPLKLISIDELKKAFEDYAPENADKFHASSAKIADKLLDEEIRKIKNKEREIIFMCGGSASGKSEFIEKFGLLLEDFDGIVFDSTFSTIKGAEIKIKKIIKSGNIPVLYLVIPDNFKRAFKAFHRRERKIPEKRFYETHSGSRKAALWVIENYPNIEVRIFENNFDASNKKEDELSYCEILFKNKEEKLDYLRQIQYSVQEIKNVIN